LAADRVTAPAGRLQPLNRLRIRLTAWYILTLGGIQLALGAGLFTVISQRFAADLDASLVDATTELIRAARIREQEAGVQGPVVDAVEELRIPDRTLYLLDTAGRSVTSGRAYGWVSAAATRAARLGRADAEREFPHERVLRLHAQRFSLRRGTPLVAVVVADKVELEDRYAALIAAFGAAAAVALVLVAAGGWWLVRKSTLPVERTLAFMRRFMADAAHELRTPTTVLRSRAEIALQQPRDAEAYVAALRSIEAESQRLSRLIDDLLMLARADAGERPIERRRVYLDDVVDDAVGAAQAVAARAGVGLAIDAFEEAPVEGDATLLRQLVMILLDNAIKFTPHGGRVRVAVWREAGRCTLRVDDTGAGIPPEQLPHVFERFYRADPARTRGDADHPSSAGAGLGLAIARWIAEAHGATIELVSSVGQGTTATVDLPVARMAPADGVPLTEPNPTTVAPSALAP
jgi:signal transduction histidine kinase